MYLQKSAQGAERLILSIPHRSCAKAIESNWSVSADGKVRAQSVVWLFCWAKTGMGSEQARQAAMSVFDQILPVRFADLDALLDHEYARKARYAAGNIEAQFERLLGTLSS